MFKGNQGQSTEKDESALSSGFGLFLGAGSEIS